MYNVPILNPSSNESFVIKESLVITGGSIPPMVIECFRFIISIIVATVEPAINEQIIANQSMINFLVPLPGLQPGTLGLGNLCSMLLSYRGFYYKNGVSDLEKVDMITP